MYEQATVVASGRTVEVEPVVRAPRVGQVLTLVINAEGVAVLPDDWDDDGR